MNKDEKLYRAVRIEIGRVYPNEEEFYLDIICLNGNQQTIASGSFEYLLEFIKKIIII